MKKFYINTVLLFIAAFLYNTEAHAQFKVDAQLRDRFELRDGYQKLAAEASIPATLISQRTRISFSYETENLRFKITPQDIRLWGGDQTWSSSGVANNTTIGLFEGYAEVKLGSLGWVSAGRQQLKYDKERILAARNWNQNGLSYDALVFKLKFSEWNLHLGSSWNSLTQTTFDNPYPTNRIKSYNFLWLNRKFSDNFSASLLHIASGVTETDSTNTLNFRQTTGIYSEYKNDNLNIWGNVYYQYGQNQKGTDVNAFLIDADASYKIGNFTPGIGLGYLSGNSKTGTDQTTDNLFDVLYGARHKYFGFIDYFRSFSSHTKQGGLADYYFYLDYKFSKSVSIRNIGHYFQLAQTNPTTPTDKNLGYENDLVLKYKFSDWGALESGYAFFLPTESLKTLQGVANDKFSQFFYLQLTITPTLFKQQAQ
ncbi:MAG: alginate export family protein [Bacteroidales bacterium]|nr:alginate export family protein [Bacteroidales bacterium]